MLEFTKMHGLGNDFVVIDAIHQKVQLNPDQIRHMANRHFGIGCDQVLLIEKPISMNADFRYRIFNADGSEVEQCGNGARCFARFVLDNQLSTKDQICVDTDKGQLVLHLRNDENFTVNMGAPHHKPKEIPIEAEKESKQYSINIASKDWRFGAVSVGNPHAVIEVNDIQNAPLDEVGPLLESHPFFPEKVNVGFMEIVDRQQIRLRVFERGVGETLACGSGACAAVVIGREQGLLENSVRVNLPGGQLLIQWRNRGDPVYMSGPAISVYEGIIDL